MNTTYVLYKGEEVIGIGTAKELAKKFNVKKNTIYFYGSNACRERYKGNRRIAVKV